MALIISEVVAEYGAYYRAGSDNLKNLNKKLFAPNGTSKNLSPVPTEDTVLRAANVFQSPVLQGYQDLWTPMGDTTFKPQDIPLFPLKVDISLIPHQIEASWLGFLGAKDTTYKDAPLVKFIAEDLVIPQMQEDYELNAVYKGKKLAITPGTPQAVADAMDGLRVLLNRGVAAGTVQVITLGAPPTDPMLFVNYVEAFVEGIPEIIRPKLRKIMMSTVLHNRYRDGMRLKYNVNYALTGSLTTLVNYEQCEVVGNLSMSGSTKIFTTIEGNMVEGTKKATGVNTLKIEENRRVVDLMTDFWRGVGFYDYRFVYSNDQDLTQV